MNEARTDPASIVEEYLRLHMIPDPDSARRFCAPGMEIRFTGNRLMHDPAEATAFNRSRYKWVKKKFGPTHVVAGGTPESLHAEYVDELAKWGKVIRDAGLKFD